MPIKKFGRLDNYLGMYRRRSALTLAELATLIGIESAGTVGRYESGECIPGFESALALAIVLGQPAEELFAGVVEKLQGQIASRAQALLEAMSDEPTVENSIKLSLLARLAHPDDEHLIPCVDAA